MSTALIVKLAAIGDVAMALPMVTALHARDPGTRITWITGRAAAPLLRCVDGIAEIVEADERAILAGDRGAKARAVASLWVTLRRRRFDRVFLAHADRRYRLLCRWVRAGELHWLGERGMRPNLVPFRRHEDEYVRLVTDVDDVRATRVEPPRIVAALDAGIEQRLQPLAGRRLIAIAAGGARNNARDDALRRWPLDRYAELARALIARGDAVLLTGDRGDAWTREGFGGLPVVDLIGETTLPGLVALYARCAGVVAHDSGPMHVARLARTRVVALFGPTPPASFVRDDSRTIAVWHAAPLACAPCYDGRNFARCDDNRCMQLITSDAALGRLDALLASAA